MRTWYEVKRLCYSGKGYVGQVQTEGIARLSGHMVSLVYLDDLLISSTYRYQILYLERFHYPHKIHYYGKD